MLYVERLQNEKKTAAGAEKGKLDLKVIEINIPDEDVKVAGFQRALQNIQVISSNENVYGPSWKQTVICWRHVCPDRIKSGRQKI